MDDGRVCGLHGLHGLQDMLIQHIDQKRQKLAQELAQLERTQAALEVITDSHGRSSSYQQYALECIQVEAVAWFKSDPPSGH